MNKKGMWALQENAIFLILNAIFFTILLSFAIMNLNGEAVHEQAYAKQIALMLDNAQEGMTFSVDISELQTYAKKNNFQGNIIDIDESKGMIKVKVSDGRAYNYFYFTNYKIQNSVRGSTLQIKVEAKN